jgi:hypothetical protein
MPKISISYRRADSAAIAGRIYDRLSAQYGEQAVFLDIDSIAVGADFRHQLQENLRASDLLLVIIGPGWLGKTPGGKTRINESHDPIRLEIETALTLGLVIVPVLVGGAVMPRPDEVPFSLQDLTFRNAAEVDSGRDFSLHMEHLIRSIDRIVDRKRQLTPPPVHERPQPLQTRVEQRTGTPNPALLANLKTIASEFFGAPAKSVSVAGRNHAQLVKLDGNRGWLCGIADPNPEDVAEFAQFLNPPERGFFIYDGGLSPSTSMALDRLRVEGKSIIPIGLNAMSAAIADGNTSVLLADLQRAYESNLFDTRNAIIDERFFFGRSELLNKVGSALARGEHVLVSGLRKCGKTSFLNILRRHLLSHPVCIVDLQRYDRHTEDWPSALFGLIIKSYDQ